MRKTGLVLLLVSVMAGTATAQTGERPGWVYSSGTGSATTEREAARLAKGAALAEAFRDIGKDELFESMFLSDWPAAVQVEEQFFEGDEESGFTATVRIAIDQNALILAEGPYAAAATGLLNRAASLVDDAETATRRATEFEGELEVQSAFGEYSRAESLLAEARIVLSPIGDDSVFSDSGANVSSLATTIDSLSATVSTGLARIDRLSSEIETEQGRRQYREVLSQVEDRLNAASSVVQAHLPKSPFYDLPVDELESMRGALTLTLDDLISVQENYRSVLTSLPEGEELAAKRVDLGLSNAERLAEHTERMIEELEREIDYPRLERQEDEARRKRRRQTVGRGIRWTFFHQPLGFFTYSQMLPLMIDHRDGRTRLPRTEYSLEVEGVVNPGLWLRTELRRSVRGGNADMYRRSLSQTVGIGLAGRRIWGLGFSWDWFAKDSVDTALFAERRVSLHLGKPNRKLNRADIMLSLGYQLPQFWGGFVAPYHLNFTFDSIVRIERILILEAMARSGLVSTIADGTSMTAAHVRDQPYQLEWRTGVGLRLPPPVTLKAYYGETYERPEGQPEADVGRVRRGWIFAVGYTI